MIQTQVLDMPPWAAQEQARMLFAIQTTIRSKGFEREVHVPAATYHLLRMGKRAVARLSDGKLHAF